MTDETNLAKFFIDKGFIPGKDFSVLEDGQYSLSDNLIDTLAQELPPERRNEFLERLKQTRTEREGKTLDEILENVGAPTDYFDRFFELSRRRLTNRLKCKDYNYVISYAENFMQGTTLKFPFLENDAFYNHAAYQMTTDPVAFYKMLQHIEQQDMQFDIDEDSMIDLLTDVLAAAAHPHEDTTLMKCDQEGLEGEELLSVQHLRIIQRVWDSSEEHPIREFIAVLEGLNKKAQ